LEEQAKKNFIINIIFVAIWIGIIFFAGSFLLKYMLPFIIAVVVAALVQKPADKISQKIKLKKGIVAALLSAFIYIVVAFVLGIVLFKLVTFAGGAVLTLSESGGETEKFFSAVENSIADIFAKLSPEMEETFNKILQGFFAELTDKISRFLSNSITNAVKGAPSVLFSSIVALAATCYIAKDYESLKKFINNMLSAKKAKTLIKLKDIFKSCVLKMLSGYLILMAITFGELALGFLILGIKNGIWLSAVIAVVDILPVFGVGTVLIPWGIINMILGNNFHGVGLIILYLLVTLVRNFAEPKIVGGKIGANPLFTLLCMFLGLKLFGFPGLVILPVTFIVIVKYYKSEMEQDSSL